MKPQIASASRYMLIASALLAASGAFAKSKPTLPAYILRAHTVAIMIDPDAGIDLEDPNANQIAQKDVETAFLNWGRFTTVMGPRQADLVIVIRRGHGKLVNETIGDPRQNSRAGVINPADNGIGIGAQHGPQPPLTGGRQPDGTQTGVDNTRPEMEIGQTEDSFAVYEGDREHPMDSPVGWRLVRKDALRPHIVPAVDEFRKAIAEAEKQAAAKSPKKP